MNILFIQSHILRRKGNDFFSTGTISENVFQRYLTKEDIMYVYTRQKEFVEGEKLVKVNGKNVICIPTNVYKGPLQYYTKRKKLKKEIEDRIEGKDFFILRIPCLMAELAYKKIKKEKRPYVLEVMGCAWDALWNYGNIQGKILAPIRYIQLKKVVKNAKYVVYVSEKFLQKRYPTKGQWIACSNVNIDTVSEEILKKRLERIENQNKNNTYKIGLIGYLNVNYKGHKTAIKAISKLKDKYNIEIHFLGAGEKERWESLIKKYKVKENVFFDGVLPAGQPVYNWLDELDLFLIPSLQEGLPRALIEAMSRGCPAVGVKTGGIPELLEEEYVTQKKDYKKIAKKIEKLLTDKNEMKRQAIRNFEKAKEYNKEILNARRNNFFETIKPKETKK